MAIDNKIQAIQGLRFLFALGVVFSHLRVFDDAFHHFGPIGVTFFFILSGYLSVNSDTRDVRSYFHKKALKIYPIQWFALILTIVACVPMRSYWNADTWWVVSLQALLLQCYFPDADVIGVFNGPSWFLSALLFYYLLLPLLQRLRHKSKKCFYLITILTCVISFTITWFTRTAEWSLSEWGKTYFPLVRLPECLLGMCLYDFSKSIRLKLGTIIEVFALFFFILVVVTIEYAPVICVQIYWWIPSLLLIVYVGANSEGKINKLLSNKIFVAGGAISMEIYMFHCIAIRFVPSIEYFVGQFPFWLDICLVFIITACMIAVYHYMIEPRVLALSKRI